MSKKTETNESYSYNTNNQNNNFNNNTNDFKESVNRSLDEAKDNIRKSIDESKNQIPRINNIVNSYQDNHSKQPWRFQRSTSTHKRKSSAHSSQHGAQSTKTTAAFLQLCIPRLHSQGIHQVCQQCSRQHSVSNQTHKQHDILKPGLMEISDATGKGQLKAPVKHGRQHGKNI